MQDVQAEVRSTLEEANQKYKDVADERRWKKVCQLDEVTVFLRKERFTHGKHNKNWSRVKYGPFRVVRVFADNANMLDLQADMRVSSTFNVKDLTVYFVYESLGFSIVAWGRPLFKKKGLCLCMNKWMRWTHLTNREHQQHQTCAHMNLARACMNQARTCRSPYTCV